MSSYAKSLPIECSLSGLAYTPLIYSPENDMENQERSLQGTLNLAFLLEESMAVVMERVRYPEAAGSMITRNWPTPLPRLSSTDRISFEMHKCFSIIVINDDNLIVDQPFSVEYQQQSSSMGLFSANKFNLANLRKHCNKWKRKISAKLRKKPAHHDRYVNDVLSITETDIEMGTYTVTDADTYVTT